MHDAAQVVVVGLHIVVLLATAFLLIGFTLKFTDVRAPSSACPISPLPDCMQMQTPLVVPSWDVLPCNYPLYSPSRLHAHADALNCPMIHCI
jgi:hypothetical protein